MASSDQKPGGETRVAVVDGESRRPFMRGILVHSLTAQGVDFDEALAAADEVRERIRGRQTVERDELRKILQEVLPVERGRGHQPPLPLPAQIGVRGSGGDGFASPFSKGRLSQSLLAAAIDPTDAFEVAREIEARLVAQGRFEVSRGELRRLAHDALEARFGPKTADRYLVWRRYQEPDKPVILLIGGPSGVGKTTIALELALRLGIHRVLSTDSIRQILRLTLSPELAPAIHGSSFDAHRRIQPVSGPLSPVLQGFRAQAETVSVGVRAMLDRAVAENENLVLDGVVLVPGLVDLSAYRDVAHVIYMLVGRFDADAYRGHFGQREDRAGRRAADRYLHNFAAILEIQEYLLDLAEEQAVPIIDNTSVDSSVLLILRNVVETLRKRADLDPATLL